MTDDLKETIFSEICGHQEQHSVKILRKICLLTPSYSPN